MVLLVPPYRDGLHNVYSSTVHLYIRELVHSARVRRARAGFRKFSGGKFMHRGCPARQGAIAGLTVYPPWIQTLLSGGSMGSLAVGISTFGNI
jgi:hypothetical protein